MSSCEGNSEESLVYREEYLNNPGQVASVFRLHFPTWVLLSNRKLSVFLAVFICLVTSSLIVFFLFPRTIAVQPVGLNSSTVATDEANVYLNITVGGCLCPCAPGLRPHLPGTTSLKPLSRVLTLGMGSQGSCGTQRMSEA